RTSTRRSGPSRAAATFPWSTTGGRRRSPPGSCATTAERAMADDDRSGGLLRWQWTLYPEGHRTRTNLLIHIVTAPLFIAGTITLLTGAAMLAWWAFAGLGAMLVTLMAQGRGHRGEAARPVPFRSPFDFVARFFV